MITSPQKFPHTALVPCENLGPIVLRNFWFSTRHWVTIDFAGAIKTCTLAMGVRPTSSN